MQDRRPSALARPRLAVAAAATALVGMLLVSPPVLASSTLPATAPAGVEAAGRDLGMGPQYTAMHVYVTPEELPRFTAAFTATFGGTAAPVSEIEITPTPSRNQWSLVQSPNAMLSVFAFTTPVPYPFGAEHVGVSLTDVDEGVARARASGAYALVSPFTDGAGRQAVVQFPGGVALQLYHASGFTLPPRATQPDHRVYLPAEIVDDFLRSYLRFSGGHVTGDERHADGARIGRPGSTYRQVVVTSSLGRTVVLGSENHLPYPYGRETLGLGVGDLDAALARATANGAQVLTPPHPDGARTSALVGFPGDVVFEVHQGT